MILRLPFFERGLLFHRLQLFRAAPTPCSPIHGSYQIATQAEELPRRDCQPTYTYTQIFCGGCGTYMTDHGVFTPSLLSGASATGHNNSSDKKNSTNASAPPTGEPPVRDPIKPRTPSPVFKPTILEPSDSPSSPASSSSSFSDSVDSSIPATPPKLTQTVSMCHLLTHMPETSENESLMASHPGTYLLHAYSSMFLPLGTHKALVPVLDDVPKHGFDGMLGMDVQKDSENPIVLLAPKFCQHGKGEEGKEAKTKNAQNNEKGDTSATEEKSNDWETVEKAEASGTAESYGDGGGEDGWVEIRSGIC